MMLPRERKRVNLFHRRGTINNYTQVDLYEACTAMGLLLVHSIEVGGREDRRLDLFVYPQNFPMGAMKAEELVGAGFDVMTYVTFTKLYLSFVAGGRVLPDVLYAPRLKAVPEFTKRTLRL